MARFRYSTGATVLTAEGDSFGTIERVTDDAIIVHHDGEFVEIPLSLLDDARSTPDLAVLAAPLQASGDTVVVRSEELETNVREVDRGTVRIHKTVEQNPVRKTVELGTDVVDIQRVAINEIVDDMPQNRLDGDVFVIPVVEEVLVLSKRYRVIEEIRIATSREQRTEIIEETLRRERVDIELVDADGHPVDSMDS